MAGPNAFFQYARSIVGQGQIIKIDIPLSNSTFQLAHDFDNKAHIEWKFTKYQGWIRLLDYRSHMIIAHDQWLEDKIMKNFNHAFYQETPCFGRFYIKNRAPIIDLFDFDSSKQDEQKLILTLGGHFDHDNFRVMRNIKTGYNAIHESTKMCFIEERTTKPYSP
jgi:hypothetical protein